MENVLKLPSHTRVIETLSTTFRGALGGWLLTAILLDSIFGLVLDRGYIASIFGAIPSIKIPLTDTVIPIELLLLGSIIVAGHLMVKRMEISWGTILCVLLLGFISLKMFNLSFVMITEMTFSLDVGGSEFNPLYQSPEKLSKYIFGFALVTFILTQNEFRNFLSPKRWEGYITTIFAISAILL